MKRPTLILLILLALMAGLYWYLQRPDNVISATMSGTATPISAPEFLIGPLAPDFAKIEVENAQGARLKLQSLGQNWTLGIDNAPAVAADANAALAAAGGIRNIRILRHLEAGSDPTQFGLDQPTHTVSILYADGSELRFRLGPATVIGSGYYAQLADGSSVILDSAGVEELLRLLENPPYQFTPTPPAADSATPEAVSSPVATP